MNEQDYAIVVGVNHYHPDSKLRNLNGAIKDAEQVYAWVLDPKGGFVPELNAKLITSPYGADYTPIQRDVDKAFGDVMSTVIEAGGANRLYFYYAGHGFGIENNTADTAFCMADWTTFFRSRTLSCQAYLNVISLFGLFKEILVFGDCCRNLKTNVEATKPGFNVPAGGRNGAGQEKSFVAFATQHQGLSYEAALEDDEVRGIFTTALLDGLYGGAADEKGIITADKLRDFLRRRTTDLAEKKGFNQKPFINHSYDDQSPNIVSNPIYTRNLNVTIELAGFGKGQTTLFNSSAAVIHTFDADVERNFTLQLPRGYYSLRDKANVSRMFFVSPVNDNCHVLID